MIPFNNTHSHATASTAYMLEVVNVFQIPLALIYYYVFKTIQCRKNKTGTFYNKISKKPSLCVLCAYI